MSGDGVICVSRSLGLPRDTARALRAPSIGRGAGVPADSSLESRERCTPLRMTIPPRRGADHGPEPPLELLGQEAPLRRRVRIQRRAGPVAGGGPIIPGERMLRARRRLRGGPVRRRERAGERGTPALADRTRSGAIDENPEDPRLKRRSALEGPNAPDHAQPRVLHDLVGDGRVRHVEARHAPQARVVLADEPRECILVPAPKRIEDRRFLKVHGYLSLARPSPSRGHPTIPAIRRGGRPRRLVTAGACPGLRQWRPTARGTGRAQNRSGGKGDLR